MKLPYINKWWIYIILFEEEFLSSLPEEPMSALVAICGHFNNFNISHKLRIDELDDYDKYLEAYALIQSIVSALGIKTPVDIPILTNERIANISIIQKFFSLLDKSASEEADKIITNNGLEKSRAVFDSFFGKTIIYEFSDGDLDRIQEIINQLRKIVTKSKSIEDSHKSRLLKKLEKLQSELHKKVSDIDRFWGLMGDAGIAIGKFGKDAKPIFDRIQEILNIVWNVQARAAELQSGFVNKLLSEDSSFEE